MAHQWSVREIVTVGLMAALVFVGSMLRITMPVAVGGTTAFHLGNIMVVLSGLLLGPVGGGLAAGLGSAMLDVINPLYTHEIPFTFFNKMVMGLMVGWIAHRAERKGMHLGWNLSAAIVGVLSYYILYFFKSFFYNGLIVDGLSPLVALVALPLKLPASLFNGVLAVVAGVPLAETLRRAMAKSGLTLSITRPEQDAVPLRKKRPPFGH